MECNSDDCNFGGILALYSVQKAGANTFNRLYISLLISSHVYFRGLNAKQISVFSEMKYALSTLPETFINMLQVS